MPITVAIDEATLTPRLEIPAAPDETVDDRAVWRMDAAILQAHPDLGERLRDARFQYLGAVKNKGRKKDEPETMTLLYTRPDPEALLSQEERDAVPVEDDAVQEETPPVAVDPVEGAPSEDAEAGDETDELSDGGEDVPPVREKPKAEKRP
jgi:hypothetical protein